MHTCIHACLHAHIHTHMHTYIRPHAHTDTTHTRVSIPTAPLPAEGKQALLFNAGICDTHMALHDDKAASP